MRKSKWLAILLTIAMIVTSIVTTGFTAVFAAGIPFLYGDVDMSGEIDMDDAFEILAFVQGKASWTKEDINFAAADVTEEYGELDMDDAFEVLAFIQGKIAKFEPADENGYGIFNGQGGTYTATLTYGAHGTATLSKGASTVSVSSVEAISDDEPVSVSSGTYTQFLLENEGAKDENGNWRYEEEQAVDSDGNPIYNGDGSPQMKQKPCEVPVSDTGSLDNDFGVPIFKNHDVLVDNEDITVTMGLGATDPNNHWHLKYDTNLQQWATQGTNNPKTIGNKNPGVAAGNALPGNGSFMVYQPHTDGTLYIKNIVFANKEYCVVSASGMEYDETTGELKNEGTVDDQVFYTRTESSASYSTEVEVFAGETYYVYALGSKIGFQGFTFIPDNVTPPENDPNMKGDDVPDPSPTPVVTEDPNFWKATENVTTETTAIGGALTFMTDLTYVSGSRTIDGVSFNGYLSSEDANGKVNGGWADGAGTGSALKFTAPSDGKLTVYTRNVGGSGGEKTFYIAEEGSAGEAEALKSFTAAGQDTGLSVNVTAGKTYYALTQGSRARFCGVKFEAGTSNPTTSPTPSGTPEPSVEPDTPTKVTAAAGTIITVTSVPDAGYKVDAVTVSNGATVTYNADKTVATFAMPSQNVEVNVTFKEFGQDTYNATLSVAGGTGTLAEAGVTTSSVETASFMQTDTGNEHLIAQWTDDNGNTVYGIENAAGETKFETTFGTDYMQVYHDGSGSPKIGTSRGSAGGKGRVLLRTGTMADTEDDLVGVVGVIMPYDGTVYPIAGKASTGEATLYAQVGLGTSNGSTIPLMDLTDVEKNDAALSDQGIDANAGDAVYFWFPNQSIGTIEAFVFEPGEGGGDNPNPIPSTKPNNSYTFKEGTTVQVNTTPDADKSDYVPTITVTTESGSEVSVMGNTFVMPSQNVAVSVTYAPAPVVTYTASLTVGAHGTATLTSGTSTASVDASEPASVKAAGGAVAVASASDVAVFDGELPDDILWSADDPAFASTLTGNTSTGGTIKGLTVPAELGNKGKKVEYTHKDGEKYTFTSQWSNFGSSSEFKFTPEQACIVTVVFNGNGSLDGKAISIMQGDEILGSHAVEIANNSAAEVAEADVQDPTAGDVIIKGTGGNKNIAAIFVEYYDPTVLVTRKLSGNITYNGTADENNTKLVFTNKDGERHDVPLKAGAYSIDVRQNRDYDITVETNGTVSKDTVVSLKTNKVYVAKADKEFDITVVDIAATKVEGDVVVHDVNNDGTSLNLSNVTLTFTAKDDNTLTYTTGISNNKLSNLVMMPNHEYIVTASGIDGYELSPLSQSYLMAGGDLTPFKNILFEETLGDVAFKSTVEVGANKEYATVSDAMAAIKKMTGRPAGEAGRVTVVIDPGTYIEQVIVDSPYVTLKAADENQKPTITFYYGIGYLYYSADGSYYNRDLAVQKTAINTVTRWGSTVRVAGTNFIAENIIFENSLNCRVTPEELADGVTAAGSGWYGDVSGKPDRTVQGFDPKTKNATERCAAFAGDAANYEAYNCEFIGSQDTFYTGYNGYIKNCYIEGGTDYIFGGNSVVFDGCTLAWHGYSDQATGGYITACKSSDKPVAGTPNMNANGYLLKNCTVTNSKYYTDNKFAAGAWGRNWGGENCQVVFDGIKIEGADTPSGWTAMSGELSNSILFVNDVTDRNGNAVNVSGTSYNPNGTMASKNYTIMDMTDYFGGWVPSHYTKTIAPVAAEQGQTMTITATPDQGYVVDTITISGAEVELISNDDKTVSTFAMPAADIEITITFKESDDFKPAEYTTTWQFGGGNGAPDYNFEGEGGTTTISGATTNPAAQILSVDATNGKFNNLNGDGTNRNDEWCNVGNNTVFTIPVVNGTVITFGSYQNGGVLSINGVSFGSTSSYTYHGNDTSVDATVATGGYMSFIKTVSPSSPEEYVPVEHNISVPTAANGTVSASATKALANTTITVTVTPNEGFKLSNAGISVTTASGKKVTVSDNSFVMPDEDVTVTAAFVEVVTEQPSTIDYEMNFASSAPVVDGVTISAAGEYKLFNDFVTLQNLGGGNDHGLQGSGSVIVKVPGKVKITIGTCLYDDVKFVITDEAGNSTAIDDVIGNQQKDASGNNGTYQCYGSNNGSVEHTYNGGATTLTITFEQATNGAAGNARFWLPYLRVQSIN